MPLFVIERNFEDGLDLDALDFGEIKLVNDEVGVNWVYSCLSADKKKTFCIYEAPTEDIVLQRLEAERVATAISELPADQRIVLVMRDIQGLPGDEVARSLGLSTAAMKSRLHRARAGVREALQIYD